MPFFVGCASPFDNLSAGFTQTTFNQRLKILKKNKNKLSIYPSDRKKQEMLKRQFDHSMSNLEPPKSLYKATDELIDEIVYNLYGLTEEEIKLGEAKDRNCCFLPIQM